MDYTRNEDKWCRTSDKLEYNNIIGVQIITDVATEPLSLVNAKLHLKVDFSDDDTYITQLIKETREQVEDEVGLALASKTIKAELRNELGYIRLPYWTPNATITELKDFEGTLVDANSYIISNGVLETGFTTNVFVQYVTGFATIPNKYLRMIKERLAFNYNSRGDEKKVNNNGVWLM